MKNVQVVPALSTFFNDEALVKNLLSINKNARKKKTQTKTWDLKLRLNIWSRIDLHACGKKTKQKYEYFIVFFQLIHYFLIYTKIKNKLSNKPPWWIYDSI